MLFPRGTSHNDEWCDSILFGTTPYKFYLLLLGVSLKKCSQKLRILVFSYFSIQFHFDWWKKRQVRTVYASLGLKKEVLVIVEYELMFACLSGHSHSSLWAWLKSPWPLLAFFSYESAWWCNIPFISKSINRKKKLVENEKWSGNENTFPEILVTSHFW